MSGAPKDLPPLQGVAPTGALSQSDPLPSTPPPSRPVRATDGQEGGAQLNRGSSIKKKKRRKFGKLPFKKTITENKTIQKALVFMGWIARKIEIVVVYLQLTALIMLLPVGYDDTKDWAGWTNVLFLDVRGSMFGDAEFRAHFLLLVCAFPLALVFFMLVFLIPLYAVVWYFMLLMSLACFIAGFTVNLLPRNEFTRTLEAQTFFVAGLVGLLLVLISWVIHFWIKRRKRRRQKTRFQDLSSKEARYKLWKDREKYLRLPRPAWVLALEVLVFAIIVFLAYVALEGGWTDSTLAELSGPLRYLSHAVGRLLVLIAVIIFFHFILVNFQAGREFLADIIVSIHHRFIGALLFLLNISFIPVTNQILSVFSCSEQTCPEGEVFQNKELTLTNVAENGFVHSGVSTTACEPCRYTNDCPEDFFFCDEAADWRLNVDPVLSCRSDMWPSYVFAAVLMCFAFTFLTTYLRFHLTKGAAKILDTMKIADGHLYRPPVQRAMRTEVSHASVTTMLRPYLKDHQYFNMYAAIFYTIVIAVSLFAIEIPELCAFVIFGLLIIGFVIVLIKRPFIEATENWLAVGCSAGLCISASVGAAISAGQTDRTAANGASVLMANAVVVCLGLFFGMWRTRSIKKQVEKIVESKGKSSNAPSTRVVIQLARLVRIPQMKEAYDRLQTQEKEEIELQARRLAAIKVAETSSGFLPEPTAAEKAAGQGASTAPDPSKMVSLTGEGAAARARLKQQTLLAKETEKTDIALTDFSERHITRHFLLLGVIAFIALTALLVDIVYNSVTTTTVPHRPTIPEDDDPDFVARHEFADNFDWETFSAECCCGREEGTAEFPVIERWTCLNGFTKQKARVQVLDDVTYSGLELRKFCSRTFEDGVCEPFWEETYDEEKWRFNYWKVEICSPEKFKGAEQTERALRRLW